MTVEAFIRRTVSLILSFGLQGLIIMVKLLVITANYMACLLAFQLLNYETWPLPEDKLLGWVFAVFAPEADLCHLYALALVLTQALGLLFLFHFAFRCLGLWRDRRWYLEHNDLQSARQAMSQFWMSLFFLVIVAIPLAYIIYWDINLFRYRGVISSFFADNPEDALRTLPNWELLHEEKASLFTMFMTRIGAEGYIGATAMICLLFEVALGKTKDNWASWWALFQTDEQLPGQPAYANGYQAEPAAGGAAEPAAQGQAPPATSTPGRAAAPQGPSAPEAAPERPAPTPAPPAATADLRPVIGGQPGEQVSLEAALQQRERYHVDPVTHEIWDRRAYEAIFGQQEAA